MSMFWTTKSRLTWCAVSANAAIAFVGIDRLLHDSTETGLARSVGELWLTIGVGVALGLIMMVWEWYQLHYQRDFLLAFHRTGFPERLQWKYQRTNMLLNGWVLLATLALIGWCYYNEVVLFPALFAMNAALFLGNHRAAEQFNVELKNADSKLA